MKSLIAAAALLALASSAHAAPKGQWFLLFDTRYCDVHDCGEKLPPDEFVHRDTYTTKKQCLVEGRRLIATDKTIAPRVLMKDETMVITPRCEWSAD